MTVFLLARSMDLIIPAHLDAKENSNDFWLVIY